MSKNLLISILLALFLSVSNLVFSQIWFRNYPTSSITPLFNKEDKFIISESINNFGMKHDISFKTNNTSFVNVSAQYNLGHIYFDPLKFNTYEKLYEKDIIRRTPNSMKYVELSYGKIIKHNSQKIETHIGLGIDYYNSSKRGYIQVNWGNESNRIYAGLFVKGGLIFDPSLIFPSLNVGLVGKYKIYDFNIYNKFEYMIPFWESSSYMVGVFSIGIEYHMQNELYEKLRNRMHYFFKTD